MLISDKKIELNLTPFHINFITREEEDEFQLPVLTPEAKLINLDPVFLQSFVALKSRICIPKKQAGIKIVEEYKIYREEIIIGMRYRENQSSIGKSSLE